MRCAVEADDVPATRADFAELSGDIRGLIRLVAATVVPMAGNRQEVNIQPQPAATRGERLLWVMAGLVLLMVFVTAIAVVASLFQGQRVTDLRVDLQAERARAEAHAAWAREEAQIVRGYIWQGKVPRLNPYPNPESKK